MPEGTANFAPTAASERVRGLDALRGLALLLILIANMPAFNSPIYYLETAGYQWWPSWTDHIVQTIVATFVQNESFALFSFLFGLGLAMQLIRAQRAGVSFVPIYVRRLLTLIAIGLCHVVFLWTGDILALYGALGFLLLLFRTLKPRLLLVLAIVLYLAAPFRWELSLIEHSTRGQKTIAVAEAQESSNIDSQQKEAQRQVINSVAAYRDGGWLDAMRQRVTDYVYYLKHNQALTVFPMFLFGLYFGRRRVFGDLKNRLSAVKRIAGVSLLVVLLGTLAMRALYLEGIPEEMILLRPLVYVTQHTSLEVLYTSAMLLAAESSMLRKATEVLAAAGRLSLSNYLLQSVICTFIFYGYGLRLYGKVGPAQGLLIAGAVFAIELYLSAIWSKRFCFGPMEWLFRGVTYGHLKNMRQRDA
jgi:uncharacterized protein